MPEREEYSDNDVVIQTRSVACGDGVCIAYHLDGNTDPSCDPSEESGDPLSQCATPERIEERAYCTCRCDGPPGSDLCDCPDGFSCVDAVSAFQPDLAGSYCVKDGMIAQ